MQSQLEFDVLRHELKNYHLFKNVNSAELMNSFVSRRSRTSVGFNTNYRLVRELEIFPDRMSKGFGTTGALLNQKVQVGFLMKAENGYLVWLEGYTFGDESWPQEIDYYTLNNVNFATGGLTL